MLNHALLIAFISATHSSRTLAARYLRRRYGYTRLSFGDSLRAAAREIFVFSNDQIKGNAADAADPFWGTSPAAIMDNIRVALSRQFAERLPRVSADLWILAFERRFAAVSAHVGPSLHIVVDDVRSESEAAAVRRLGGVLVRLEHLGNEDSAPDCPQAARIACDFAIRADGPISDLHKRLDDLMETIRNEVP